MAVMNLQVTIQGVPAGILHQDEAGMMSFAYRKGYAGIPLSLSMPVSNRAYNQKVVRPYLFGLLPDSESQRMAIASEFDVKPNNPVALLFHIGRDCPGAVQFFPCDENGSVKDREVRREAYRPVLDHEIALRLKEIRTSDDDSWMGRDESWSLGGYQGKFALALRDGVWCACEGTAATTHIFKNGVRGYKLEALNEYVCMRTAQLCGIPTANVSYLTFEDEPALVIERYDRMRGIAGTIVRVHQEDCCQALGYMPNMKYTKDGGPSTASIIKLLGTTGEAAINIRQFTHMLFYNYAIGAPDAHAKNYSLLLGKAGGVLLAKMYDVASGLCYDELRKKGRLAMPIGGENRFGRMGRGAIERYAGKNDVEVAAIMERVGLDTSGCVETLASLVQRVPGAMEEVFDEAGKLPGVDELRSRLLGEVRELCETTLRQL
ncbi:MAG: type II toxin-antitoxin system HipA family toxin [Coriobacteriales bacterium]|nr:type II toxin-antitoxin system HipA family toxin [Coriobacteriales bacterium]